MFDHTQYRRPLPQGVQLEQLAEHAFRDGGFLAERSSILDTKYAVDFLVSKCMRLYLPMPRQILVQITCKVNDTAKFLNFAKKAKQLQPNAARLYVEVKEENRQLHFHRFPFIAALDRILTDTDLQNESLFRVYVEGFFSRFQVIHSLADFKRNVLPTSRRRSRRDDFEDDSGGRSGRRSRSRSDRGRSDSDSRSGDARVRTGGGRGSESQKPTRVGPKDRSESDSRREADAKARGGRRGEESKPAERSQPDRKDGRSRPDRDDARGRRDGRRSDSATEVEAKAKTQRADDDKGRGKPDARGERPERRDGRRDDTRRDEARRDDSQRGDRDESKKRDESKGRDRNEDRSEQERGEREGRGRRGRRGRGRRGGGDEARDSGAKTQRPIPQEPDPEDYDWDLYDTSTPKTRNEQRERTPIRERKPEEPKPAAKAPEREDNRPRRAAEATPDPDFFDWDGQSDDAEYSSSIESIKARRLAASQSLPGDDSADDGDDEAKGKSKGERKGRESGRATSTDDESKKSESKRPDSKKDSDERDSKKSDPAKAGDDDASSDGDDESRGSKKKSAKKRAKRKKKASAKKESDDSDSDDKDSDEDSEGRVSGYLRVWHQNAGKPAQEFGVAYDSDGAEYYCHQRSFADRNNLAALRKHVSENGSEDEDEVMLNVPVTFRPGRRRRTDGRFSALEVTADEI